MEEIPKNLFIRCSNETYKLAHKLAKSESRSLNKQIIYMIHQEAKDKGITIDCSNETYKLAHKLAKSESRSLNKQIIYMIHQEAKDKKITIDKEPSVMGGLEALAEKKK